MTAGYVQFDGTNRFDPFTGTIHPAAPAGCVTGVLTGNFLYLTATPRADRGVFF